MTSECNSETVRKRRSRRLALEADFGLRWHCPKTLPLRRPQIADSIRVKFVVITAHKQIFLGRPFSAPLSMTATSGPQEHQQYDNLYSRKR
jgi:hypothetical protein